MRPLSKLTEWPPLLGVSHTPGCINDRRNPISISAFSNPLTVTAHSRARRSAPGRNSSRLRNGSGNGRVVVAGALRARPCGRFRLALDDCRVDLRLTTLHRIGKRVHGCLGLYDWRGAIGDAMRIQNRPVVMKEKCGSCLEVGGASTAL